MLLNPLSLMGGAYADNSLTWSAQRTLNWLPETAEVEGTRTPIKFADVPGLRAVVDLGTGSSIRGLHNVEGTLFAVSGSSLFEISTAFAATNRGNIPGVSRVSMAHNKQGGATAANELVIANGLSGYVYNTSTNALAQITDEAFQGATTVDYVDGYITFTDPQGRFWGHSGLNQATSYNSIDRYDAESAPDPIISHIVSHREVMVFGTRTTEFFRNTGAATGTFQRVDGTELEIGICAPFARSRVDNSVCWVGDGLEVFRLEGHGAQRISTRPIEQLLHTVNPANIFTFAWEDRGHKVFYVTAPEAFTIGFDFASGMWHERQTFDIPRWRANDLVSWNGLWIVGDFSNGLLYVLDWDTHHENGLPLVRERASGYTHGGQNKVLAPYVELLFDAGPDGDLPEIVGDVPDGIEGESTSGAYVVTGGIVPYGPITVLSGTFPPGLTLDPDGTYSGTYAAGGSYSWVVGGEDAFGVPFSTPDSATVTSVWGWVAQQDLSQNYARSLSGTNWQEEANRTHAGFSTQHISAVGGRFITGAALSSSYAVSVDGALTWAAYPSMPAGTSSGGKTIEIDGVYLSPRGQLPTNGIARTTDLSGAWTVALASGSGTAPMHCISARIGLALVGVDNGRVTRSTDNGQNWSALTQVFPSGIAIQGIANNGTRFVLVGNDHTMRYSDDGTAFTAITSPFTRSGGTSAQNIIGAVAYGKGVFVAGVDTAFGGTPGQMAYSLDGASWTLGTGGLGGGCLCIAYAGGLFVAVGRNSKIATSPDGINWTQRANHFAGDIRSVAALLGEPLSP